MSLSRIELIHSDCLSAMLFMEDDSVDSIVTDPPYGLGFMGKEWDRGVPCVAIWKEALRVLKPGGHLLSFGGSRTYHRMASAVEDAGFEIRDQIMWVYGCLDEATEVATESGVMPYHKTKIGDRVLCYDAEHGEYTYQPILEIVEYDYSDTAYRLVGDFGEQVVSRNHRVLVERGGKEAFQLAETLGAEACVPVLENLPALQQAVRCTESESGFAQQDMQQGVCQCADWGRKHVFDASGSAPGRDDQMRGLRGGSLEAKRLASKKSYADVQPGMQRCASGCPMGDPCTQGQGELVRRVRGGVEGANDRRNEPRVEGWVDVPKSEGRVCGSTDQVCALPCADAVNGAVGRLCDGAPIIGGACDWANLDAGGVRTPHQPQSDGQPAGKPDAVCDERAAQGVRAWGGHRSAMVRVVPFHYTGKVWCLRVPTGAFVAVRNGVAFPTGNSGFPKSHNGDWGGTALKPAHEPIVMARKPLIGTVEKNWNAWGVGALNIDGCRVGGDVSEMEGRSGASTRGLYEGGIGIDETWTPNTAGRWPANLIHDGSAEVVGAFPQAPGQQAGVSNTAPSDKTSNVYGVMKRTGEASQDSDNDGVVGFKMKPGARRLDAGSAARFFYCAKASRKDRNAGLETKVELDLQWSNKTESLVWGNEARKVLLLVDTEQSPPKVIAVSGAANNNAHEWNTMLFGNCSTGQSRRVLTSTTKTKTNSITRSEILSFCRESITSANTRGVLSETVLFGNLVESAELSILSIAITNARMVSALGADPAALQTLLRISASGAKSTHPTVKPTDLMAYLCRLVTPPGGVILDMFMGSGSTGKAAVREGFRFIGIEREAASVTIAQARIDHEMAKTGGAA